MSSLMLCRIQYLRFVHNDSILYSRAWAWFDEAQEKPKAEVCVFR